MTDITTLMATMKPGKYAILYRDNWDGEGDTYHCLASLGVDGKWHDEEFNAELLQYEGDEILKSWPLDDGSNVLALVETLEKAQRYIDRLREWNANLAYESCEYQKRIDELESRTVTVKLPQRQEPTSSGHYGEGYLVPSYSGSALDYEDTIEALTAAGIQVIEGEGQHGGNCE